MSTGWKYKKQSKNEPLMTIGATPENNIILFSQGSEMLRVAEDGFYVRGVKIKQDDNEAEQVYNAFKQWLSWTVLNNQQ